MAGPAPMEGDPLSKRGLSDNVYYDATLLALARAMLAECDADPSLLDPTASFNCRLWDSVMARPGLVGWLGSPSGYMFGCAENAVRFALGRPGVANPARVRVRL